MQCPARARLVAALMAVVVTAPAVAPAQPARPAAGINQEQGAPGSAGPGPGVVQRGGQPNPAEVRPGSPDGDAPSASAGQLLRNPQRRILGLPVNTALMIGGVLLALLMLGWIVIPATRNRRRARGGGTYGGPS